MTNKGMGIETMSWNDFIEAVRNEKLKGSEKLDIFMLRRFIIKKAKVLFSSYPHFSDIDGDYRNLIAGIPNGLETQEMHTMLKNANKESFETNKGIRYRYTMSGRFMNAGTYIGTCFGNMGASGIFKQKINENNKNISLALDQIPLTGEVTKQHYINYWKHFNKEFSETSIALSTRLLCMKRPDFFLCFDSANKKRLSIEFNLSESKKYTKDNYWDDILSRIYKSAWYKTPKTDFENDEEKLVYDARVAFLDAVYYWRSIVR